MKVLLLGSGGREHALAWKIAQSKFLSGLFIAPGNAGTINSGENVDIGVNDFDKIKKFIFSQQIDMLVIGPEEPLVKGIYEYLKADDLLKNLKIIGPSTQGAMLEGSKDFAKQFMKKYQIPTASYQSFYKNQLSAAISYLKSTTPPYVLKADGLAAGKGVLILKSLDETQNALADMFNGKFGAAGDTVVIEEFLKGIEMSVFIITDGKSYKILPEAKDYKRVGENDTGLNTGGMGAVSPVPFADQTFMNKVENKIIKPTIEGIKNEGFMYQGFIFFGLINVNNEPYVIEYNCRLGDPESEVVIPRLKSDILEILIATAENNLDKVTVEFESKAAATVMMVSGGYPQDYEKGKIINLPVKINNDTIIFHAGTKLTGEKIVTNGGRVLSITSLGENIFKALEKSYRCIDNIYFEKQYFRKDIGFDFK